MPKNAKTYLLVGSGFLVGVVLGLISNNFSAFKPQQSTLPSTESLYTAQTAVIRGQIIKVNRDSLTVKNSNTGVTGDLKISDSLVITKFSSGAKSVASSSSNLRDIDLDKDALVNLEMKDGSYQATLIQFAAPPPSLPPAELPKASSSIDNDR